MTPPPILLYDGHCAWCNGVVRFVLRHDRRGEMKFAALHTAYAREVLARHPAVSGYDTAAVVEVSGGVERVRVRSDATLAIADYLGGVWKLAHALRVIPRPLRDIAYDAFARVRYRIFGRYESCPLPPPGVRERFVGENEG